MFKFVAQPYAAWEIGQQASNKSELLLAWRGMSNLSVPNKQLESVLHLENLINSFSQLVGFELWWRSC